MPKADRAYTSGADSQTQQSRRPLTWNQAMDHAQAAKKALTDLLIERGSASHYRAVIQQVLRDHIEPMAGADTRTRRPGPASDPDRRFMAPHLRALTDEQLADYRLLKRAGYTKEDALAAVKKPRPTVRAPTAEELKAAPRGPLHGLTDRQADDRYTLMRRGQFAVAEVIAAADRQANAEARS